MLQSNVNDMSKLDDNMYFISIYIVSSRIYM